MSVDDELIKNNLGLKILTDTGWSNFDGLLEKGQKQTVEVTTETKSITCTPDHNFFTSAYKLIEAKRLKPGLKILVDNGTEKIVSINMTLD